MQIFDFDYKNSKSVGCVLALGNFDGVHSGHLHLLKRAREFASQSGKSFGIYTFRDSPKFQNPCHSVLTTTDMRLSLFESEAQCDFVYFEGFERVRNFSPEEFVDYLIEKFNCDCVFCGDNFSFGKNACGKSVHLEELMQKKGRECVIVSGLCIDGGVVSSTRIISLIKSGDTETARRLLSRPYSFASVVLHGKALGHSLGFPTINQIMPQELVCPSFGVYATVACVDGKEYTAVTNFGIKPTVETGGDAIAETHIIGFDGDIYGKNIEIRFYKKLRDENKFSSLEELKMQISADAENSVGYFREIYEKN